LTSADDGTGSGGSEIRGTKERRHIFAIERVQELKESQLLIRITLDHARVKNTSNIGGETTRVKFSRDIKDALDIGKNVVVCDIESATHTHSLALTY